MFAKNTNEVTDLRRTVDIDPGYLSRILARFEADGLIARRRSAADGRRQVIQLTDTGRSVVTGLDARSAEQTRDMLAAVRDEDRFGWDTSYEALVARIVADYVDHRDPDAEAAWIAEVDGTLAGCVFCVRENASTARLRLLLVEPWARGLGIGARLVDEVLRFARQTGYSQVTLWTNSVLADARRIYQRAGFTLDNESHHHSFGTDLTGQNWSRRL